MAEQQKKDVVLEVKKLKKFFDTPKGRLHAVDNVSFRLERGKTLGVVGESGCGKSTLGRTILFLTSHTSGDVIFNGEHIFQAGKKRQKELRQEMQMIFQDPFSSLNPKMTVSQLIEEPLNIHHMCKTKQERQERVVKLMETVGLDARYVNTYPHELDGGRRQRIGIARALALEPQLIVCDEPVSALDVSIQAQILNLLMDAKDEMGLTYIFITHDLSVVKHISDEILVLYMGKMVERAAPDELFRNPMHPYTKARLNAIPVPELESSGKELEVMKGEVSSPVDPKPGCRFAPRCPYASELCFQKTPKFGLRGEGHYVACHLYPKQPPAAAPQPADAPADGA